MPIYDIYSKRLRKMEGDVPEVYVYDDLPKPLRVQIVQIWTDCVVELKDGHEFDTKSSAKEQANLHTFLSKNAMALGDFRSFCKIVGFNANTKEEIQVGFKNKIALEQAMTGEEFCMLLGLDYKQIVHQRREDAKANYDNFINELLSIDSILTKIVDRLDG